MTAKSTPSLQLDLQFSGDTLAARWPLSRQRLRRLIQASLPAACRSIEITVRVVGRREGQALNREFRGKDYPTNVLTFSYCGLPTIAADLVLCEPVVATEAKRQKKPLDHHLAHLVVHGVLHAAGLDHEKHKEAIQMEALETAILKRFRIPDPYREGL